MPMLKIEAIQPIRNPFVFAVNQIRNDKWHSSHWKCNGNDRNEIESDSKMKDMSICEIEVLQGMAKLIKTIVIGSKYVKTKKICLIFYN